MQSTSTFHKILTVAAGVALAAVAFTVAADDSVVAEHQPADKMTAVGSTLEIMSTPLSEGESSEEHTVLTGTIRTSKTTDLVLRLTSECALWTDVTTVGNDESEAVATVTMWVEIDGTPVPVSSADDGDDAGKVVFCNRAYKRVTELWDDENATIKTFMSSRAANAFDWVILDVGDGIHTIEVKAQIDAQVSGTGNAHGGVGKRTLTVDPVKLANDAVI